MRPTDKTRNQVARRQGDHSILYASLELSYRVGW